jgi:uncharacterized protein DUF5343
MCYTRRHMIEHNGNAPYASPKNVLEVIERYRHRGLRSPFTIELLTQIGVPDGAAPRTLQALRLLDLIDEDGQPTEAFEALKLANESEYRPRLEQLVRSAYHSVFEVVDPAAHDATAIRDAFRPFKPDSQWDRQVTLFLALCEEAGIIDKGPKKRGRAKKAQTGRAATSGRSVASTSPGQNPPPPPPAADDPSRDPAITGVLARLPKTHRWTERERERWFRALEGAVDLLVETTADPAGAAADGR